MGVYGGAYRHTDAVVGVVVSQSSSCGNPLHQYTHTVVGENGSWGSAAPALPFNRIA